MKKFLAALFVLAAFTFTMCPATTAYASMEKISSIQTVDCSWWGKMVNGDYYKGKDGQRRLEQQRRQQRQRQWQEQQRRQQRRY